MTSKFFKSGDKRGIKLHTRKVISTRLCLLLNFNELDNKPLYLTLQLSSLCWLLLFPQRLIIKHKIDYSCHETRTNVSIIWWQGRKAVDIIGHLKNTMSTIYNFSTNKHRIIKKQKRSSLRLKSSSIEWFAESWAKHM